MTPPRIKLSTSLEELGLSATLAINEISQQLIADGQTIYKFGLGQSPFPVPEPLQAALRTHAGEKSYLPVAGLPALQEAIVAYLERTRQLGYEPEDVIIGPGSKELLLLLQLATYAELLLPSPSWVSYEPQGVIAGQQVSWLHTHKDNNWKLIPDTLDQHCRQQPECCRTLILNYPNNPTGHTYTGDELMALAEVLKRYKVLVVADEIYSGLDHQGQYNSLARYYPEGTIISDGISKWSGAGGWRLGFMAFPTQLGGLRKAMQTVVSESFTAVSAPIQYGAIEAFQPSAEMSCYLDRSRQILERLGCHLASQLRAAGCQLQDPAGGFYLFPDFSAHASKLKKRGIYTSPQLCEQLLLETGVAVLPGSAFGRPEQEYSLRLSYVDFDGAMALGALESGHKLDEEFLRRYCQNCLVGVERLTDWLQS